MFDLVLEKNKNISQKLPKWYTRLHNSAWLFFLLTLWQLKIYEANSGFFSKENVRYPVWT